MDIEAKKQRLKKYLSLRKEIDNELERPIRMRNEEKIPAMKQGDGSKKTGGASDRMADAVVRRLAYEELKLPKIEANQAELDKIDRAIDDLPDPMERELLRMRYTDSDTYRHRKWRDIAIMIYGDDEDRFLLAVSRMHNRALQHIVFEDDLQSEELEVIE